MTPDTRATFSAKPGSTYCFSARAHDSGGSLSAWSNTVCSAIPLDDRGLGRSAGWTAGSGAAYYESTFLRTFAYGARLTRTGAAARAIHLVATTCPTCGTVKVYMGGTLLRKISLHSETTLTKQLLGVWSWSSVHRGTITIKVASSGKKVTIDGLTISRMIH